MRSIAACSLVAFEELWSEVVCSPGHSLFELLTPSLAECFKGILCRYLLLTLAYKMGLHLVLHVPEVALTEMDEVFRSSRFPSAAAGISATTHHWR